MNAAHTNTAASTAVVCEQLSHSYTDAGGGAVHALREVDLVVDRAEAVALLGPSGAGKSTLLTILAGLTRPTDGRVRVAGTEITGLTERGLTRLRARRIGIVLQTPGRNVLPYATARQNVAFGQRSGKGRRSARRAEADDLLTAVGLDEHRDRLARLLSGGQQQRLALAVALAGRPAVLLADEPTSQLDQRTGDGIVQVLLDARERYGTALVVVTHDSRVSAALDSEYALHDGALVRSGRQG